jgi:NADH-quinone oxidoreductase subunit E
MATQETSYTLTPELKQFIAEKKNVPGNLIMVLHRVQEHFGFIPRQVAFEVADALNIPLAKVYGVITFYHFFKLKKPGKYKISVCLGTACYLKGGGDILAELENILGVGLNAVTPDGLFSVEAVRCIGCCGLAPVCAINGTDIHGTLKKEDIPAIVGQYQAREAAAAEASA